jgi:polysaccharide biosynthesis protein PslG
LVQKALRQSNLLAVTLSLIALISSSCGSGLPKPPVGRITPLRLGFNSWISSQNLALQKQVGLPIRRFFVYWSASEPSRGQWDWQQADAQYQSVLAAGLTPMIVAMGSPCWARPNIPCDDSSYTGPPDPAYDPDWTEFVRNLAARYPKAIGIEIWNEPNLIQFFYPSIDPSRYTQLLKEAYTAIKTVQPNIPVISAGLAASPAIGGNTAGEGDAPYLTSMYRAGAGSAMDAIGIHPYPEIHTNDMTAIGWDAAQMELTLARLRAVRNAAGGNQPIWITEVGESTATDGPLQAVTPAQQATDLLTLIRTAQHDPDIPVMLIHTVQDGRSALAASGGFGVFTASGSPKPAACAISQSVRGALNC